jgi:hypothetical protein
LNTLAAKFSGFPFICQTFDSLVVAEAISRRDFPRRASDNGFLTRRSNHQLVFGLHNRRESPLGKIFSSVTFQTSAHNSKEDKFAGTKVYDGAHPESKKMDHFEAWIACFQ